MERIYGVSLEQLAAFAAKYSELQTKYGEPESRAAFEHWLLTRGSDFDGFTRAHKGWFERFRADPSGKLYARYLFLEAERCQKAHFAELRDMSQDTLAGVTLERYAELTVAMAKAGSDVEALAREHGLSDVAQWLGVNAAWSRALREDTQRELTRQFGRLYQKFAGTASIEQQMLATAAILAEANRPQERDSEPDLLETPEGFLHKLTSNSRNERWRAARRLAHAIDIGAARGPRYRAACVPVLLETIEEHDDQSVSEAERAASLLLDLGERTSVVKGTLTRCLLRAEERLASLRAALGSIHDQALPQRIVLRALIQGYCSLVSSLQGSLVDLEENGARAPLSAPSPSSRRSTSSVGVGFSLPLVAGLLVVGSGLAFWLYQTTSPEVSFSAATVAVDSARLAAVNTRASASAQAQAVSAEPAAPATKPAEVGTSKALH